MGCGTCELVEVAEVVVVDFSVEAGGKPRMGLMVGTEGENNI